MTDELRCADCSGEVRMIRVMRDYLRLGHVHQPATLHPVRLARTTAERPSEGLEDSRRSSEGSDLSPDPALGVDPEPRRARRVRAGSLPTPSGARVVVGPPSTPRAPLAAGRPT